MNAASFCVSVHGAPVRPVLCLSAPLPGPGCPRGWGPGGALFVEGLVRALSQYRKSGRLKPGDA